MIDRVPDPYVDPPAALAATYGAAEGPAGGGRLDWALGVALGALGRYGAAAEHLDAVLGAAADPVLESLAASTRASHLRQLGRHAEAEELDQHAVRLGQDDPDARSDALLGLAADAIGTDLELAGRRVAAAVEEHRRSPLAGMWRPRVRLSWIEAELALASGQPERAVAVAHPAVTLAGSERHRAKTQMVYGVALADLDPVRGLAELESASASARRLHVLPVLWPAAVVRARIAEDPLGHWEIAAAARDEAAAAIATIAGWLPAPDAAAWKIRHSVVFSRRSSDEFR